MMQALRIAWRQLLGEHIRFLVALVGVAFAVILVFMQFGFNDALFRSAVRVHDHLAADLVLINPKSPYLVAMKGFPRRRLFQVRGVAGVSQVAGAYTAIGSWRNPDDGHAREIFVLGFDPADRVVDIPGVAAERALLRRPDVVLFDRASRSEYGPIGSYLSQQPSLPVEVSGRRVDVVGLYQMGTSFGIDGSVVTSDLNFLRLFPHRDKELIDIGLIRLSQGADPVAVRADLESELQHDVLVLTKDEYAEREIAYWADATAIGFVFGFGATMAFIVGAVIVYQILFSDITTHLAEYATLRAMGYTTRFLAAVVLGEAIILAVLGFLPGIGMVAWLYRLTESSTLLPMSLDFDRTAQIFLMTLGMCSSAALFALRKVRAADPAEVF